MLFANESPSRLLVYAHDLPSADRQHFLLCSSVDYDAMLAADTKHRKEDQEDHGDDDDVSMQSSDQVGSFDQDDTDDGAADSRVDSGDEDKELLPTEDDFLRLEDMERFLQVSIFRFLITDDDDPRYKCKSCSRNGHVVSMRIAPMQLLSCVCWLG